jgi:hypothetical protein
VLPQTLNSRRVFKRVLVVVENGNFHGEITGETETKTYSLTTQGPGHPEALEG